MSTAPKKGSKVPSRKRSQAAKRGWVTRRRHQRAKHRRRVSAAKHGWITRRKRAQAAIELGFAPETGGGAVAGITPPPEFLKRADEYFGEDESFDFGPGDEDEDEY